MKNGQGYTKIINWFSDRFNHRQQMYVFSLFIGIVSGLAAVLLKNTVHYTHQFVLKYGGYFQINFLYLAFPMLGILLTVLYVKYLVKDEMGHGITKVLYSISKKGGFLRPHNSYSSIIASTLTVGFGGSVGLESPIVVTGSSMGSSLGRLFGMNYKSITTLIGCGAAGAVAGIFKAPVAGVVFALEVLMLDIGVWSIIPLLISAVTGATISYLFLDPGVSLHYPVQGNFNLHNIPLYIVLGLFAGIVSLYFTRMTFSIEKLFAKIGSRTTRWIIGGLVLGLLILFLPLLYGEGYDILNDFLEGNISSITHGSIFSGHEGSLWYFVVFMVLVLLFKPIAMTATTGAGGVGGIFAPSMFMGGFTGYLAAKLLNQIHFINVPEQNFILSGMAGLMAGVMHAPLFAIFLIAEITGGYVLFIPLMITSTVSFITIRYFEPHSIYTHRLATRGELITHNKDKAILTLLDMDKLIEKDFVPVTPADSLGKLVKAISRSKRNLFPVITGKNILVGVVLLDSIRHIIFNSEMYNQVFVRDLMQPPPTHISPGDSMESVMKKFEDNEAWNLPVVNNGEYIGFLSKSKLFSYYRNWLIEISED
ncbi:MAG TPA: chloride channel protein [Bacteroidales bacterium]|nr:chloride channel protein [Bacteroidales bacterium]